MSAEASKGEVVVITRFKVDPANIEELKAKHDSLVSALRPVASGPREAELGRVDDQTWAVVWRWDTAEQLRTAQQNAQSVPEVAAAFALISDVSGEAVEVAQRV
ncbi:antibiotic biosynthesis monooxygenase [Actinoallomurus oryzae]